MADNILDRFDSIIEEDKKVSDGKKIRIGLIGTGWICEAHIKGYQYLRDAIMMTVKDNDMINAVTKQLYPEVAKKHKTSNVDGQVYSTPVHSFTHGNDYNMVVSRDYLTASDRVLLVDDFLANGAALRGLVELVNQAKATLCGAAIAIEKRFQGGGDELRGRGVRVESLAIIDSMGDDFLVFGK